MKLFSWMQNKLSGNQSSSNTIHKRDEKEEFSDWPNGFLSIGTLFNKASKDENNTKEQNEANKENDQNLTSEEVKQLQKELSALISSTDLGCLSSFEADDSKALPTNNTDDNDDLEETDDQQHYTIVLNNKTRDVCYDSNNNSGAISKKSLSFLLKKIFVCGSGFSAPTFSLRDPTMLPPKTTRMNKILRALLRKKIYPQSTSPTMTRKKCLDSRCAGNSNFDEEDDNDDNFYLEGSDSSKWVKTDTEYIVLEI